MELSSAKQGENQKQKLRLLKSPRGDGEFQQEFTKEQILLNNSWASGVLQVFPNDFALIELERLKKPEPVPLYTEHSPNKQEEENYINKIDSEHVKKYLDHRDDTASPEVQQIKTVSYPVVAYNYKPSIPSNCYSRADKYLKVKIDDIKIIDHSDSTVYGYIQLYHKAEQRIASAPIHFRTNETGAQFLFTNLDYAYIEIEEPNDDISLLCVLYTSNDNTDLIQPYVAGTASIFDSQLKPKRLEFQPKWPELKGHNDSDFKKGVDGTIPITCEISTQYFTKKPETDFSYSWAPSDKPLLAPLISMKNNSLSSVITVSSILAQIDKFPKPKEATHIYLRLFLVDDVVNLQEIQEGTSPVVNPPFIEAHELPKNCYESCAFFGDKSEVIGIPDIIQIVVDHQLSPSSKLVAQFVTIHANDRKTPKPWKVAIIPLFNVDSTRKNQYPIIDATEKRAFEKEFKIKKESLTCQISIPTSLLPPTSFEPLISATDEVPDGFNVSEIDKEILADSGLHVICKLLRICSVKSLEMLFTLSKILDFNQYLPWVYHHMDINAVCEDFVSKFSKSYPKAVNSNRLAASSSADFLLQVLLIALHSVANFDSSDVTPIFIAISEIIGQLFVDNKLKEAKSLNEMFAHIFFSALPLLDFSKVYNAMYEHISGLMSILDDRSNHSEIYTMIFDFLAPFSYSTDFARGISEIIQPVNTDNPYSPFNKLLSVIFLATQNSFSEQLPDPVIHASGFYSRLVVMLENVDREVGEKIAFALFPLISIISDYFDTKVMRMNSRSQLSLIPVVLILLTLSKPHQLQAYFHSLGATSQAAFIDFFKVMGMTFETQFKVMPPTYDNPTTSLNLFDQLTRRILIVLVTLKEDLLPIIDKVIDLAHSLCNEYQPVQNLIEFYKWINIITVEYGTQRPIIKWLIELVQSNLHETRCFATAALLTQYLRDYEKNSNVLLSGLNTIDLIVGVILSSPMEKIDFYVQFSKLATKLSPVFENKELDGEVKEKMAEISKLITSITQQRTSKAPHEKRARDIMKIANYNRQYPSIRLKWLREIVRINQEANNNVSAFITQMHIVALCVAVYDYQAKLENPSKYTGPLEKQLPPFHLSVVQPICHIHPENKYVKTQTELDFAFMPEILDELTIDWNKMASHAKVLLTDFSLQLVQEELNKAVELGLKAKLAYSLRPLHSLQMRYNHLSRNEAASGDVCASLESVFQCITANQVTTKHDNPVDFFLVEYRKSKERKKQVYCVEKGQDPLEVLASENRFDGLQMKICNGHAAKKCADDGVCVVPLIPKTDDFFGGDEHQHTWKRFKTIIDPEAAKSASIDAKELTVLQFKTEQSMPHYRMASDVKISSIETTKKTLRQFLTRQINYTTETVVKLATELEIWFRNEVNVDYELSPKSMFGGELQRVPVLVNAIIDGNVRDHLILLASKDPQASTMMANEVRNALNRLMMVYRAGLKQLHLGDDLINPLLEKIGEFTTFFNLPELTDDMYKGRPDLMTVKYSFE